MCDERAYEEKGVEGCVGCVMKGCVCCGRGVEGRVGCWRVWNERLC